MVIDTEAEDLNMVDFTFKDQNNGDWNCVTSSRIVSLFYWAGSVPDIEKISRLFVRY